MYENEYMYAIERDPEYLAHYGIKGMKWGVRKAIERGNQRALGRQYRKAQKKLAKLEKRAANGAKYARRAARLGAGAAAAGGLAALGTGGVSNVMRGAGNYATAGMRGIGSGLSNLGAAAGRAATTSRGMNPRMRKILGRSAAALGAGGKAVTSASGAVSRGMRRGASAVGTWGKQTTLSDAARRGFATGASKAADAVGGRGGKAIYGASGKVLNRVPKGVSNNTIARIGAGAVGAGLAGGAAYNAYRAATTKRAAKKAAQFRSEMNKAFKGTQYANGGNRQGKKRRRRG